MLATSLPIRATVCSIMATIAFARSAGGLRLSSDTPFWIAAIGLRRSWLLPAPCPDLVAERGLDRQFVAGFQSEAHPIQNLASDPPVLGDARYRRKAHAGRLAGDFENGADGGDRLNRFDIGVESFGAGLREGLHGSA
jgi:hypothetical protein